MGLGHCDFVGGGIFTLSGAGFMASRGAIVSMASVGGRGDWSSSGGPCAPARSDAVQRSPHTHRV